LHRRGDVTQAGIAEEKIARRFAKLEKERDELRNIVQRVWQRMDREDIEDRPALALDISYAVGGAETAYNIAWDYEQQISGISSDYARKVAKILKPKKRRG
jgi:hypothetical protein